MMFHIPFWILMAVFAAGAWVTIKLKGFSFLDFQVIIMIIAVSFFLDMVFCKWLDFYAYVTLGDLQAFYSLVFCVIGYPAIGFIFYKFLPDTGGKIILYIIISVAVLTLIELLLVPFGIVLYERWVIIPWSPLIYTLSYTWVYGYYKVLRKILPGRLSGSKQAVGSDASNQ